MASAVLPVVPRPSLREQVVNRVADEAAREPVQFQGLANALALNAVPVTPQASLRERVMEHLEGHTDVRLDSLKGLIFVKASEGVWQEMASGISAKVLYFDRSSRCTTAFVRMAPGSRYAPFCGGRELKTRDCHRAEADTEHHDTSRTKGGLLLIISSPHNEMFSWPCSVADFMKGFPTLSQPSVPQLPLLRRDPLFKLDRQ